MLKDTDLRKEVAQIKSEMKISLDSVREELDVHLDSINQGTDEIQQNYEYLAALEGKIDKLSERMDRIELLLAPKQQLSRIELSHREQEIFLILYSASEKLTKKMMARRLGFTEEMVAGYLANIIAKGVPILRQVMDSEEHFFIDIKFRELQAKHKLVPLNESIVKELFI